MRAWKTPEGHTLLTDPDHAEVFHLLDGAGVLKRTYRPHVDSVQEHRCTTSYAVEDGALVRSFEDRNSDSPEESPARTRAVEIQGLLALEDAGTPTKEALRAAISESEQRDRRSARDGRRSERKRLDDFFRSLPDYPSEERLHFVWRYEEGGVFPTILILGPRGETVWRLEGYPYSGKYLIEDLRRELKKRYGSRFERVSVDPASDDERFNPD